MREKVKKVPKAKIDKWVLTMHHNNIPISTLHQQCFIMSRVTVHNAINHGMATQTTIDKLDKYFSNLNKQK